MTMCKQLPANPAREILRRTLAQYPTGVAVVTASHTNGKPLAMTINSLHAISLIPPLIGWSLDRLAPNYAAFAKVEHFAISVLSEHQEEIASRFATAGNDACGDTGILTKTDPNNATPLIVANASAWFQCETYNRFLLGDHLLLIGQVLDSDYRVAQPLVSLRGTYHSLKHPLAGQTIT